MNLIATNRRFVAFVAVKGLHDGRAETPFATIAWDFLGAVVLGAADERDSSRCPE
jgi:hypothetical protein